MGVSTSDPFISMSCVPEPNVTPCKSKHSPEGRDVAQLDSLTQSRDAFDGVGATAPRVEAAELVAGQTAMGWARKVRERGCQGALTQKQTLWSS